MQVCATAVSVVATVLGRVTEWCLECRMYGDIESLIKDYENGLLHPGDLKPALTRALNSILEPVRKHFQTDKRAADLLKRVKAFKVTR